MFSVRIETYSFSNVNENELKRIIDVIKQSLEKLGYRIEREFQSEKRNGYGKFYYMYFSK